LTKTGTITLQTYIFTKKFYFKYSKCSSFELSIYQRQTYFNKDIKHNNCAFYYDDNNNCFLSSKSA